MFNKANLTRSAPLFVDWYSTIRSIVFPNKLRNFLKHFWIHSYNLAKFKANQQLKQNKKILSWLVRSAFWKADSQYIILKYRVNVGYIDKFYCLYRFLRFWRWRFGTFLNHSIFKLVFFNSPGFTLASPPN